jgi:hypothetical protein
MSDAGAEQIRSLASEAELTRVSSRRFDDCARLRPLVISVVRNERPRLRDFLDHYRRAGAGHFLFIDNGSTDGTRDALSGEPDVDLFETDAPFSAARKHGWITRLIEQYGDRWYLLADADEHAVFAGAPDLEAVAAAAERSGRRRVRGALLDMYSDRPIVDAARTPGQSLLEAYPFFDADGYIETREAALTTRVGGPRQRAFSTLDPSFAPQLTKYPLFRLAPEDTLVSPHYIHPPLPGEDPCWIALLHFKFDEGAPERIADAVRQGQYWRDSYEYRVYQEAITRFPGFSLMSEHSRRYRGPSDLVELGIIERVRQPGARGVLRKLSGLVLGDRRPT